MTNKETEMFHKQAMALLEQGEIQKSIEFFDKALKFDDEYFPAWNNKGIAYLELKDYPRALECFEQVARLNPADKMALYNRGYVLLMLEEYGESVKIFDYFLSTCPRTNDFFKFGLYLQAKGFYGLKEYDKVISLLNDAIKLDKKFKEAQELRSLVLKEMGKKE